MQLTQLNIKPIWEAALASFPQSDLVCTGRKGSLMMTMSEGDWDVSPYAEYFQLENGYSGMIWLSWRETKGLSIWSHFTVTDEYDTKAETIFCYDIECRKWHRLYHHATN